MKIAVFYYINFSGAKRVVFEHVKGLRLLDNLVDVYTTDKNRDVFDPGVYANNKYVYSFNPLALHIPIADRAKKDFYDTFLILKNLHKKIADDIDNKKYDLVLVHTDIHTQAPYILRYLKTKSVYYCLEPLRNAYEYSLRLENNFSPLNKMYENVNRYIRKKIDRDNTLSADRILTLSHFARERIIAAYDRYPKISYLGIDESVFKPLDIAKKEQVLFIADKLPIYGYDLAVKAIELIPKHIRPQLRIISWKKNNAERISDEDLVRLYNQSSLTLSLSKFDTFGLVPLESMACAIPVIALNVAGYRETIVNNKTGYLVDFSPQEIAQKIIYLLSHPKESKEIGKAGRKWNRRKLDLENANKKTQ